jgi:hypothetical protein
LKSFCRASAIFTPGYLEERDCIFASWEMSLRVSEIATA